MEQGELHLKSNRSPADWRTEPCGGARPFLVKGDAHERRDPLALGTPCAIIPRPQRRATLTQALMGPVSYHLSPAVHQPAGGGRCHLSLRRDVLPGVGLAPGLISPIGMYWRARLTGSRRSESFEITTAASTALNRAALERVRDLAPCSASSYFLPASTSPVPAMTTGPTWPPSSPPWPRGQSAPLSPRNREPTANRPEGATALARPGPPLSPAIQRARPSLGRPAQPAARSSAASRLARRQGQELAARTRR